MQRIHQNRWNDAEGVVGENCESLDGERWVLPSHASGIQTNDEEALRKEGANLPGLPESLSDTDHLWCIVCVQVRGPNSL